MEFLNADAIRATTAIPTILAAPPEQWRHLFHEHPEWRALRTFRDLLDHAHELLDDAPQDALVLTIVVLRELRACHAPTHASLLQTQARGIAWKEHGSALRACGKRRHALLAADRAVRILAGSDALIVEHAAARVLQAHLWHESGLTAQALATFAECATVFDQYQEPHRYLQVIVYTAIVRYHLGDFRRTSELLARAQETATLLGDDRELARILNNRGHCELALGHHAEAWKYLVMASAAFTALGMSAEVPRATWGLARVLRDRGDLGSVLHHLDGVYTAFRDRGMLFDAAAVLLDVASVLVESGAMPEARMLCAEMLTLFSRAGYGEQAQRALEHLRHAALRVQTPLTEEISKIRHFFSRLRSDQRATFATTDH